MCRFAARKCFTVAAIRFPAHVVAKSAQLRFCLPAKTAFASLHLLFPMRPLRWAASGTLYGRQSCRFLETGSLHPPLAALRPFPPFSFPAGKENGPCTVQKKSAFGVQLYPLGAKLDGWESSESVPPIFCKSSAGCAILGTRVEMHRRS